MEANAPGDAAHAAAQPKRGKLNRHLCTVDGKRFFFQLTQQEPDLTLPATSASSNLSIQTHSPRRLPQTGCNVKALTK